MNQIWGDLPEFCHHTKSTIGNSVDGCFDGYVLGPDVIKLSPLHNKQAFKKINGQTNPMLNQNDEDISFCTIPQIVDYKIQKKGQEKII